MWKYLLVLLLTITPFVHPCNASPPFLPGERISYTVRWMKIKAGQMSLEVAPMASVMGQTCWHFIMEGRSSGFVDVFYKVRDRIDAYTDMDMTHSVFYAKKTRGSKNKDERIEFDWAQGQASYIKNGTLRKTVKIPPETFDPFSVFYFFRLKSFTPGKIIRASVSNGKKCVMGEGRVVGRETITVQGRLYDCVVVIPDLKHIGGAFRHGRDASMKMWLTSDPRHIPVKIETKVKVGTITVELDSFSPGDLGLNNGLTFGLLGR